MLLELYAPLRAFTFRRRKSFTAVTIRTRRSYIRPLSMTPLPTYCGCHICRNRMRLIANHELTVCDKIRMYFMSCSVPGKYSGLLVLWLLLITSIPAWAFTTNDAGTIFSSYNSAFYIQSGTNAYFKNSQTDGSEAYFWGQAETIECVIDSYEWTSNSATRAMITNLLNGFISNNGSSWTWDIYNDDIMWAVMAFARGGADTGMTNYCNLAKANFDAVYARAWDTKLGGRIILEYHEDEIEERLCQWSGRSSIAASLLYGIYGDTNYWNKATNIYYWERSVLFNSGSGAIYDNIGTNGALKAPGPAPITRELFLGRQILSGRPTTQR